MGSEEFVEEELRAARSALSDAKTMRHVDVTDEAIVNRLYYACFHAANAVLYSKGLEPSTHRGTIALFGEHVVLAGDAMKADGRLLNTLRDYRERADYGYDPIDVDVDGLFERTKAFSTRWKRCCEDGS